MVYDLHSHQAMLVFIAFLCGVAFSKDVCVVLVPNKYAVWKIDRGDGNPAIERGIRTFVADMVKKGFSIYVIGRKLENLEGVTFYGSKGLTYASDFEAAWKELRDTLSEGGDNLVFYFGGHGCPEGIMFSRRGEHEAKGEVRGIGWAILAASLGQLNFAHRFAILDCCNSGGAAGSFHDHQISLLAAAGATEKTRIGTMYFDDSEREPQLRCTYFTWWLHREVMFSGDISLFEESAFREAFLSFCQKVRPKEWEVPCPQPEVHILDNDKKQFAEIMARGKNDARSLAFDEINSISNSLDHLRALLQRRRLRRSVRAYLLEQLPVLEHEVSSLRESLNKANLEMSRRRHRRHRRHHSRCQ